MKFKKLWQVLVFALLTELIVILFPRAYYFLENKIFTEKSLAFAYFSGGIERLLLTFIEILILKKLGKINILKSNGKGFWRGVLIGSAMLIFPIFWGFMGIIGNIIDTQNVNWYPLSVIVAIVFMFITVGIVEETYHRGILLNVIGDYFGYKNAGSVWKTVILSGFLFGFFHFSNILSGIDFLSVLNQVISCIGGGIFYSAVYIRCRNIYSLMFLHAVNDIFMATHMFIVGHYIQDSFSPSQANFVFGFIMMMINILLAMFLLRKSKMKEIIDSDTSQIKSAAIEQ